MKKIILITLTVIVTLLAAAIANDRVLAGDNSQARGQMIAALSTSSDACGQTAGRGPSSSSALACRSGASTSSNTLMAAVSCGANQWCCKHDDFSKGTCVK